MGVGAVCMCARPALPPTSLLQPALGDGWGRAMGDALREGRGRSAMVQTFTLLWSLHIGCEGVWHVRKKMAKALEPDSQERQPQLSHLFFVIGPAFLPVYVSVYSFMTWEWHHPTCNTVVGVESDCVCKGPSEWKHIQEILNYTFKLYISNRSFTKLIALTGLTL